MTRTHRSRRTAVALVATLGLTATLALDACSSGGSSDGSAAGSTDAISGSVAGDAPAESAARRAVATDIGDRVQRKAVISTGRVQLRATDVAAARRDVRRVVDRYDGEVTSDETDSDDEGRTVNARLVLRVPSADFDAAMGALRGVAELAYGSSDEKDVTTKVIDTRVRLRAQRRSVARVETLLDRAQNLRDIVLIESELSQRQAALDSLEQQSAYLADQTSMATITVDIEHERHAGATTHEDRTGFLAGLSAGWHGLTAVAVGLATALGALLPFLVVLLVLALLAWPALRALRRRRTPPTTPLPEG
ncbi:DUF4349 domain-containing protein [Nocardioides sp. MAHUQ-72]|uniref:DUF4349 domain-containing protein n=1 Tax=unclassified Nocardioides TaxID=2615069 RepID=UPI00361B88AF